MTEYEILLKEASKATRESAKHYVPRLYEALLVENQGMTPKEARGRIEKDCSDFWSKRTILAELPAEAKDPVKQEAGKLRHKELKKNFAAEPAAETIDPTDKQKQKITVGVDGHQHIEDSHATVQGESNWTEGTRAADGEHEVHVDPQSDRSEAFFLEISIPDELIDNYRKSRPVQDEWLKVTRICVNVDSRTEQVVSIQAGGLAGGSGGN